jgi:hypothetical protein
MAQSRNPHPDDLAIWPDGFWARLSEVHGGQFAHRSDDHEIVASDDRDRLGELGLADEFDWADEVGDRADLPAAPLGPTGGR